ncbi:MAG: glycosyltransferase family 4 protein [Bacteroidota bacterium]|nr:glycosyltransferase family 4 protein [Bacteroidota bacterium]
MKPSETAVRVVISVGGRFHAVALAEQLERRGMLERIITTKPWYVSGTLPRERWVALPAPEYIGAFLRLIGPLRRAGYPSYVKDNIFDAMARRRIPPCDVFHAWGNYALISIPVVRSFGARVVIERGSAHPRFQEEILREEFERYGMRTEHPHPQIIEKGLREIELADRVIIPSAFVRHTFLAHGVPEEKLVLAPYGADLTRFRKLPKRDTVFRVLFVGNIGVQKGVHYLLEAWRRLSAIQGELVLVGRVEPDIRSILAEHEGHFVHVGYVPPTELPRWYSDASVFVLPSLQEGSALVTYEAMACGVPSIVTEHTGSVVRDGVDGFVVPVRDAGAIAEKILWFHDHPAEAERMGSNAMEHVAQFTWARYADVVTGVYRQLCGEWGEAV